MREDPSGEHPPASYVLARDRWLRHHRPDLRHRAPAHSCTISLPHQLFDTYDTIDFEELDPDDTVCGAWADDGQRIAFGPAKQVLATVASGPDADHWVAAVIDALSADRSWPYRRSLLEVADGAGQLGHLTATANRASIHRHGLDWTHMGDIPGIAGSPTPELPAVFLDELPAINFFTHMARTPLDLWAVDVTGLQLQNGPDGWWIHTHPIPPNRLHLLQADIPPGHHRRQSATPNATPEARRQRAGRHGH